MMHVVPCRARFKLRRVSDVGVQQLWAGILAGVGLVDVM
jgi:hypothetical protein